MLAKLIFPLMVLGFSCGPLLGQELSNEDLKRLLSWSTEKKFVAEIREKFSDLKVRQQLEFYRLSSVVAIPVTHGANLSLDLLAKGALIGGLYISSGSTRLGLPPGIYSVEIRFDSKSYAWKVDHRDKTGKVASTIDAKVRAAQKIDGLVAYVDHSVCYRADSWVVCY